MPLSLENTPGEWDGTFVVTAAALVRDLLLDGDIEILVRHDEGRHQGSLTGFKNEKYLVFAGGRMIDIFTVHRIEVG